MSQIDNAQVIAWVQEMRDSKHFSSTPAFTELLKFAQNDFQPLFNCLKYSQHEDKKVLVKFFLLIEKVYGLIHPDTCHVFMELMNKTENREIRTFIGIHVWEMLECSEKRNLPVAMLNMLLDEDAYIRHLMTKLAGRAASVTAIPYLILLLNDDEKRVRFAAAASLALIPNAEAELVSRRWTTKRLKEIREKGESDGDFLIWELLDD